MKITVCLLFVLMALTLRQSAYAQEYTAQDSVSFKKSLAETYSDTEKIDYQLKLAEYSIRKPGSFKVDLDNARLLIERAKKINARLKSTAAQGHILFEECHLSQEYGPSAKGKLMCEAAIKLLKTGQDKYLIGAAYEALAFYYQLETIKGCQTKIALTRQAIGFYKQAGNKFKTASTLQYLADLYSYSSDYPNSLKAINESLAIYNSVHYQKLQGLYDLMGGIYSIQDDFDNGLKYSLIALKISDKLRDSSMQACEINNHIGVMLLGAKQFKNAIPYFKSAQQLAKKNLDTNSTILVSNNLANCYNKLGQPKEILQTLNQTAGLYQESKQPSWLNVRVDALYLAAFIKSGQPSRARLYADKLLDIAKSKSIMPQSLNDIYMSLISYYFSTKNYGQELAFLSLNQQITNKWNIASREADNLQMWYKMDSARNDYKNGFYHLQAFKTLTDSVFNERKIKQISRLQVQYETEKKEADIKILTQNAKIDQVQLRSAQLVRNVTLGGILIIILMAAIQYKRYREKQKNNMLITEKNNILTKLVAEKEWLLKEVHHRVKNNLHTVICLLESQAVYLENDALRAIENSRHRIYAMSLIHQKLYQSDDIKVIDMNLYLTEFVEYLKESFGSPEHINVKLQAEAIKLGAAQAIPIGLIINEAVNNSYKYAFPNQKQGEITVVLKKAGDDVFLSIADNGIGFKQKNDQETNSLGLELIKGLTLDLHGQLTLNTDNGTRIELYFYIDHMAVSANEEELSILNA